MKLLLGGPSNTPHCPCGFKLIIQHDSGHPAMSTNLHVSTHKGKEEAPFKGQLLVNGVSPSIFAFVLYFSHVPINTWEIIGKLLSGYNSGSIEFLTITRKFRIALQNILRRVVGCILINISS